MTTYSGWIFYAGGWLPLVIQSWSYDVRNPFTPGGERGYDPPGAERPRMPAQDEGTVNFSKRVRLLDRWYSPPPRKLPFREEERQ